VRPCEPAVRVALFECCLEVDFGVLSNIIEEVAEVVIPEIWRKEIQIAKHRAAPTVTPSQSPLSLFAPGLLGPSETIISLTAFWSKNVFANLMPFG
jgi:hypothetical protein